MADQEYGSAPNTYPDGSPRPAPVRGDFAVPDASHPQSGPPAQQYQPAPQYSATAVGTPQPGAFSSAQGAPQYPPPVGAPLGQPLGAPTTQRNWMGIVSLILGLLGGGLLGAIFGGLGISGAKRGIATNRTMAVWGLVLNIAVPVLLFGGFVVAGLVSGSLSEDRISFDAVAVGECVQVPGGWNDDAAELSSDYVTRVPCDETHWGQVYYRGMLEGTVYPGDDESQFAAEDLCYSDAAAAHLDPAYIDQAYVYYVLPTRASWGQNDRSVICFSSNLDHDVSGSWVLDS